jgi:hypothetical protein
MIGLNVTALKDTKASQYVVRFLCGGLCTVAAGLIAKRYGPAIGGLFLAFPAIFPAGASLIESHEKERKAKIGRDGTTRGRLAASIDASGASLGAIGLIGFAFVVWQALRHANAILVIVGASVVWMILSVCLWIARRSIRHGLWKSPRCGR